MTSEDNKMAFLKWFQAWNDCDLDMLDKLVASDFRAFYNGHSQPVDQNRQEHKHRVKHSFDIYPDLTNSIEEVAANGDVVMGYGTLTGTHRGQAEGGALPDNKKWYVHFSVMTRWQDGKLHEERRFWGKWDHVE